VSRRRRLLIATPALLFGLAACGSGVVTAEETATKAEEALEEQPGTRRDVPSVDGNTVNFDTRVAEEPAG
jgi:ferric-dicitrate binding protein FerR (iron transport regulator)